MLNTGASIPIFGLGWAGVCTQQYFPKVCLSLHQHVAVSQGCCWRCCAGGNTRWLPPSWWCVDLQERGGDRSCTGGPLQGGCGQERGALHHIKTLVKIIITVWLAVWLLTVSVVFYKLCTGIFIILLKKLYQLAEILYGSLNWITLIFTWLVHTSIASMIIFVRSCKNEVIW